jgi:hypothetical protein
MNWLGALLLAAAVPAAGSVNVPFVGCPADGQVGPKAAPPSRPMPAVPAAYARALAWYVSVGDAVLAPRGWHCFEIYGSDGGTLVVTPQPLSYRLIQGRGHRFAGPAVLSEYRAGGTSGRFEVADLIARYFPAHRGFIRQVRDMGLTLQNLPRGPYPADRIRSRTSTTVRLTTPAGRVGEGTDFWLAPNGEPVESLIVLHPEADMDAATVSVRLPRAQAALAPAIIAGWRRR